MRGSLLNILALIIFIPISAQAGWEIKPKTSSILSENDKVLVLTSQAIGSDFDSDISLLSRMTLATKEQIEQQLKKEGKKTYIVQTTQEARKENPGIDAYKDTDERRITLHITYIINEQRVDNKDIYIITVIRQIWKNPHKNSDLKKLLEINKDSNYFFPTTFVATTRDEVPDLLGEEVRKAAENLTTYLINNSQ